MRSPFWLVFWLASFVSVQANQQKNLDDIFQVDLQAAIECEVELNEDNYSSVQLGELVTYDRREVTLRKSNRRVSDMRIGRCGFNTANYRCQWGEGSFVELDLAKPVVRELPDNSFSYVVYGSFFRAGKPVGSGVSCRLI